MGIDKKRKKHMVEITGVDMIAFVKKVYDLSDPQGMGFIHYEGGELPDEIAQEIIDSGHSHIALRMDYVKGRSCKMTVFREDDGTLWINKDWYDHCEPQMEELLSSCGIQLKTAEA